MKNLFCISVIVFLFSNASAQSVFKDSLSGFNVSKVVLEAHLRGFDVLDTKAFVKHKEREFITTKFKMTPTSNPVVVMNNNNSTGKYGTNLTANAPCLNEGFEGLPQGALSATSGWTSSIANMVLPYSILCSPNPGGFSANSFYNTVLPTPVNDANCNNVPTSPFGGNNVVLINNSGIPATNVKIKQTFQVTTSNFIYEYAYKAVSNGATHLCCDAPSFIFNFYDCSGNIISASSRTLSPNLNSCNWPTPSTTWSLNVSGLAYTPNWVIISENLSSYIGSCVTVEVIASGCTAGAHFGYCYYDANCANQGIIANDQVVSSGSYTSCVGTATLSGFSGFNSYAWQGPASSGISGSTNSFVTTNTPGNYTLTASIGSLVTTQTLNLSISNDPGLSISGSNTVCLGNSMTLQAVGSSGSTYTWTTIPNNPSTFLQSISITPTAAVIYSVVSTNSLGCMFFASNSISVLTTPTVTILSPSAALCPGQSVSLFASSGPVASYSWSNGANQAYITVSPSVSTVYTATVINQAGCKKSAFTSIYVYPSPQMHMTVSSPSICAGRSVVLNSGGTGIISYAWNTGSLTPYISVTPSITTVYSATVTNSNGCQQSMSNTITVYPLPQIQIVGSNSAVCAGQAVNFIVIGTNIGSILWNTGASTQSISMSPSQNSVYSVSVTSAAGCVSTDSKTIQVLPLPQMQVTVSSPSICLGSIAHLNASGANLISYQWSTGAGVQNIVVSPTVTTHYSVLGTDNYGCTVIDSAIVRIVICADTTNITGIKNYSGSNTGLIIFPNPSSDSFTIKGYNSESAELINELGQIIRLINLSVENNYSTTISGLAKGVYVVRNNYSSYKVIVK